MEAKKLKIEPRTEMGKNQSRRLRKGGFIPGVIYSHGKTELVKIPQKEFMKLFKDRISESVIFSIEGGEKQSGGRMAYVKDYQRHPMSGEILHVDLFSVTKDEKIHTHVPIEFVGVPRGVKMGGILEVEAREIEVECLPLALPEKIQVDVTNLDTGDAIHVKDLILGEGVKSHSNPDMVIATVHIPKIAAEPKPEEAAAEAAEPESKAAEEGESKE